MTTVQQPPDETAKQFTPGDRVIRIGEPEGPVGRVLDVSPGQLYAQVSFSGLSPLWMRYSGIERLADTPPDVDEQRACPCPTHTTPGTYHDRVTTVHVRSCRLYRAGDPITVAYGPGTLDTLLDSAFGPVTR